MLHYTEAIGLDIGSHAVKAVHIRRRWGRISIEKAVRVRLPADAEERRRVLDSFVTKNGWRGLPCVLAPPVDGVMLQSIDVDPQDPRPIASIVDLEMSQLSGLSEATTIRDYIVTRDIGVRHVVLAVGRVDSVQAAVDLAVAAGLRPVQVTPQCTALYNVVARQWRGGRKSSFIIVDVGHHRTTVVVGNRTRLLDARHIPLGGGTFSRGLQKLGAEGGAAASAELDRWTEALASCLSVCAGTGSDDGTTPPEAIILTGGGAQIEGLRERLSSRFDQPVSRLSQLMSKPQIEHAERMALATGLALAGMGIGRIRLTLLPASTREAITLHSQAGYWVASGIALICAILSLLGGTALDLYRKQTSLANAQERLRTLTLAEEELASLRDSNTQLEDQIRPFTSLVHNGDILRTAVGAVTRALHPNDWLTRIADASCYFNGQDVPPKGITPFEQIVIEGHTPATDLATIRAMIEELRNSPGVLDADLLGDDALERMHADHPRPQRDDCETFAIGLTLPTP
jgi:Tfp pilus assembly PilM family ATPase